MTSSDALNMHIENITNIEVRTLNSETQLKDFCFWFYTDVPQIQSIWGMLVLMKFD